MESFYEKVYNLVRRIPKGKVTTYGEIARVLGSVRFSRAVGYALHSNPYFGEVPCHRVVNRFGGLAPNFAFGSSKMQKAMLEDEGIQFSEGDTVDLKQYMYTYGCKSADMSVNRQN